jgi:flagellar motor component MotA
MSVIGELNRRINKRPMESKKWIMSIIGLSCVMFTYISGVIFMMMSTDSKASAFISLANIVVMFIGALVGAYTTGQSFVDWKSTTTLETALKTETKREDIHITKDIRIIQQYEEKYKDDPSYAPLDYMPVGDES